MTIIKYGSTRSNLVRCKGYKLSLILHLLMNFASFFLMWSFPLTRKEESTTPWKRRRETRNGSGWHPFASQPFTILIYLFVETWKILTPGQNKPDICHKKICHVEKFSTWEMWRKSVVWRKYVYNLRCFVEFYPVWLQNLFIAIYAVFHEKIWVKNFACWEKWQISGMGRRSQNLIKVWGVNDWTKESKALKNI